MPYIARDETGSIVGRSARPQHDGQEFLAYDHADMRALALAETWNVFRAERDRWLVETDFALLSDNPGGLTAAEQDKLKAYRVALRDLPAATADPTAPAWPTLAAAIRAKLGLAAE